MAEVAEELQCAVQALGGYGIGGAALFQFEDIEDLIAGGEQPTKRVSQCKGHALALAVVKLAAAWVFGHLQVLEGPEPHLHRRGQRAGSGAGPFAGDAAHLGGPGAEESQEDLAGHRHGQLAALHGLGAFIGGFELSVAHAKPPKAAAADVAPTPTLPADALKRLRSGDPTQVKSALDDVRVAAKASAPAVSTIGELLQHGMTPELTQAALDAIGDTESEAGSQAVAWYTRDRSAAIRRSAVQVLARTRGPAAVTALRASLSDPDRACGAWPPPGSGA